jgi:hypothetical protein
VTDHHAHAHDHNHGHGHDHGHHHGHDENPHAGQGAVMLDIGGDVGALVVTMPESMLGEEIEILGMRHDHGHEPRDGHRPHVAVVPRPVAGRAVPSLVFPELVEGGYALVPKGTDDVRLTVEVHGGAVTAATWPA